jgi:hypothetical protein
MRRHIPERTGRAMTGLVRAFALSLALVGFAPVGMAQAQGLEGLTWPEQKCVLYQGAWDVALDSVGPDGISEAFIAGSAEFVASGCTIRGNVCPRSPQEFKLADLLTLMTMNEGMASTFAPFRCAPDT